MMNLCLDNIIFSLQKSGGISVYWAHLLEGLLQRDDCAVSVIERQDARNNLQRKVLYLPEQALIPDSRLPLQIARYLPLFKPCPGTGIFHSSYYRVPFCRGMKHVVTVHDFTYERYRSGLARHIHGSQKRLAIQHADHLICVSQSTANDLCRFFPGIPRTRISVIYHGCSPVFQPLKPVVPPMLAHLKETPYILFVGDRSGYKNFHLAVDVARRLKAVHLVAVGGQPISATEQEDLATRLEGRFHYMGNVSDNTLNSLYNHAFCLLYPSAYEGFGLPALEAMKAGCPVVALNSSSLPEVCGDAALLVKQACPEAFAAMINLLYIETVRHTIREKAFAQANKFSWEAACLKTFDVYKELIYAA
jgi:mannosyltransferase